MFGIETINSTGSYKRFKSHTKHFFSKISGANLCIAVRKCHAFVKTEQFITLISVCESCDFATMIGLADATHLARNLIASRSIYS